MPLLCLAFSWFNLNWIGIGVCKYMTEYYFVHVHMITFCWGALSFYALSRPWQKMTVNLHAAHKKTHLRAAHEALLTCFLLSCSTLIITSMQYIKISPVQYMKVDLRAVHFMSQVFLTQNTTKLKNTSVFTTCKCQLTVDVNYTVFHE